jgi:hypothetical protein
VIVVLSTGSIQTPDQHRAAVPIEPGLNAVADMGRSIDPGVLIMGDTDFLPVGVAYEIRTALQSLDLANDRDGGRFSNTQGHALLFTQRPRNDSHPERFL